MDGINITTWILTGAILWLVYKFSRAFEQPEPATERELDELRRQVARLSRANLWAERYQLEHLIGEGGVGTVWAALDTKMSRQVALKILRINADSKTKRRFEREAKVAAGLDHPSIVKIYDYDEHSDQLWIAMQRLHGVTLRIQLDMMGAVPETMTLRAMREICEALVVAHGAGLVHRDLKPENVVIEHGRCVIVDFGLAFATSPSSDLARGAETRDLISGTPHYMAPEQFRTDEHLTSACDIYALGVMLFEMLSGELPFSAKSLPAFGIEHTQTTPDVSVIPTQWQGLVGAMLSKSAGHRPDAEGVLAALDQVSESRATEDFKP